MTNRTTHFLLAALVALMMFSVAMQQHQSSQNQRLLNKLVAKLEVEPVQIAMARPQPATQIPPRPDPQVQPEPVNPAPQPQPPVSANPIEPPQPEPDVGPVVPPVAPVRPQPEPVHVASPQPLPHPQPLPAADHQVAWEMHGEQVTTIIRQLLSGEYPQVVEQFNDDMAAVLNQQRLAAAMEPLRRDHGPLRRVLTHEPPAIELPRHLNAFVVTVETRTGSNLTFTITLDATKRIAGLYVK